MQYSSLNYTELPELLPEGQNTVLATVIRTYGSTPQKTGSSALIQSGKLLAGTVGGGTTELTVIQDAQAMLKSKKSKLISFDLYGEIEKGSDSICGGGMTILLDAHPELSSGVFQQLKNSLSKHVPGVLVTWIEHSEDIKIQRFWISKENSFSLPDVLKRKIEPAISFLFEKAASACELIELQDLELKKNDFVFLESLFPPPSLVIAGAGHIGRSLAHLGKFLGFETIVWDDRPEFAKKELIPDADFVWSGTIDSLMEKINIQEDSYLVIVTRGHKNDAEILRKFVAKPLAYLGMIGSKAKVAKMKTAFLENKWATQEQWNRIYTPIGLNIGGQSVEEIAISIAAQLVQVRNLKQIKQ